MKNREKQHEASINHIKRITGQLTALEETINRDSSCIEISTEMYSILQSMKGLSNRMFVNSLQNSIIQSDLNESELAKLGKIMRLVS